MRNILDGVQPSELTIPKEVAQLREMVINTKLSLIDRLECYEDITSLEVGDTSLQRARSLEREADIRQLFLKYEGDNPTGTQKDRIAFAQIHDALRRGYDKVALATCGNYGVAMAYAAYLAGVHCKVYIPETYHTERIKEMQGFDAEIIRLKGSYEDVVTASSTLAVKNNWYDANPGGANTPLQVAAYAKIADEIYDQLRDAPKYIACPVSNGTLMAGIYRGFVTLYKRGKTSRIPIFVAASSANKNPIIRSFQLGHEHCQDIKPEQIKETKINEPLINWHSFDGEEALYALKETNGAAHHISDKKMQKMTSYLNKKEGYRVLPASTAGLIALMEIHEKKPLVNDRYVAILTAKN